MAASLFPFLSGCTAAEQTAETATPSVTPTTVNSDADRRAIYNSNGGTTGENARPDATPNTQRLGEQAADINRRKRIETLNTNDANNTTPETRLQRLDNDAPQPEIHSQPSGAPQNQSPNPR